MYNYVHTVNLNEYTQYVEEYKTLFHNKQYSSTFHNAVTSFASYIERYLSQVLYEQDIFNMNMINMGNVTTESDNLVDCGVINTFEYCNVINCGEI